MEPDELWLSYSIIPRGTVWWSWTATESTPVILQVVKVTGARYPSTPTHQVNLHDSVNVWHPTNLGAGFPKADSQSPQHPVDSLDFDPSALGYFLVFTGYVGNSYQIQLGTINSNATYTFALTATNAPVIFGQPRDARIAPGQCALFTVEAAGVLPLKYQWQFNGATMSGANSFFYGITNGTLSQSGDYSVIVSNATGVSTSSVAHLWVRQDEAAPSLSAIRPNSSGGFQFALQGEAGRYYRIETSGNLRDWLAEAVFPWETRMDFSPNPNPVTSVVFPTNFPGLFSVPATNAARFVRFSRYAPSNEVCNLFLKQIRQAKNVWAIEKRRAFTDTPADTDIFTISPVSKPACPSGGFYILESVGSPPRCTYGHVLEEPR
jgi:hypothetical protein